MPLLSMLSQIKRDWEAHGKDWTKPGFRAVAVHRFGNWRTEIDSRVLRAPLTLAYRSMYRHCRNHYGIELPYSVQLGDQVVFEHQGGVVIHGDAVIGDRCILRQGVTLGIKNTSEPHKAPVLAHGVDVGAGAVILGAVHVGEGACIGANAVVLQDVPAGAVAVGVPAQVKTKATSTTARPRVPTDTALN
jgi:serine O-acetyltransferase